jgi:hypothetical protein
MSDKIVCEEKDINLFVENCMLGYCRLAPEPNRTSELILLNSKEFCKINIFGLISDELLADLQKALNEKTVFIIYESDMHVVLSEIKKGDGDGSRTKFTAGEGKSTAELTFSISWE